MAEPQIAIFAAGCFWGVQSAFDALPGVLETRVGYTGGTVDSPSYAQVCTSQTGHAEAIEIRFDPARISYESLLNAFFALHDPTQLNRQGPDIGPQYRSAIFAQDSAQESAARARIAALDASGRFARKIATTIEPKARFWEAEEYHQKYLEKRGLGSCHG